MEAGSRETEAGSPKSEVGRPKLGVGSRKLDAEKMQTGYFFFLQYSPTALVPFLFPSLEALSQSLQANSSCFV